MLNNKKKIIISNHNYNKKKITETITMIQRKK